MSELKIKSNLYLNWIQEKMKEIELSDEHKPHPDAKLLQFLSIMIAVSRFKLPSDVLTYSSDINRLADIARFEAGLFLIATLEKWSGFVISPHSTDKHQVQKLAAWKYSFIALSIEATKLDPKTVIEIAEHRCGLYRAMYAQNLQIVEILGVVADFIDRAFVGGQPVNSVGPAFSLSLNRLMIAKFCTAWAVDEIGKVYDVLEGFGFKSA